MPSLVSPNISTNAFKSPVKTAITNPQSVNLTCLQHRENTQIVQIDRRHDQQPQSFIHKYKHTHKTTRYLRNTNTTKKEPK